LPSLKEGLGISLLEAMASKVPCIASKVGGIPEVLGEGMGGILVKPGDYMELYAAMRYLLNNRDKSVELAEKGYNLAKNGFRSADMIKDLESVYLSTGLM
jgi:Glycosyl transferases group 1.